MLNKLLIITSLCLLPFPALSSELLGVFTGFSIALILGVSLPILFLSFLMRKSIALRWPFILLVSFSGIALLSCLFYPNTFSPAISATVAVIYMLLLSLWPLYNNVRTTAVTEEKLSKKKSKKSNVESRNTPANADNSTQSLGLFYKRKTITRIATSVFFIAAFLYLVLVWLYPHFGLSNGWAATSLIYLVVNCVCLLKLTDKSKENKSFKYGLVTLYLSLVLFCVMTFLWFEGGIDAVAVVITITLSILCSFVIGSWPLVANILLALQKDQKNIQEKVHQVSVDDMFQITHDPATNLPNAQQAYKYFELNSRQLPGHQFAAVTFKPINFKQVNSVLGFHHSDILLLQLAYRIQVALTQNDNLLRFDECSEPIRLVRLQSLQFMVICDLGNASHYEGSKNKQSSIEDQMQRLCKQISDAVPEAMSFKSLSLNFELAFGISITPTNGFNVSEVIAHATDALLVAETSDKKIQYFDANSIHDNERQLVFMERLRKDILDQNLYCFLQPQVDCINGDLVGFELLVHWYKWLNEPLELSEFIELAEYSGELHSLMKHMLRQAVSSIATLQRLHHHCKVSVKISSDILLETDLVDFIEQQIKEQKISSSYLVIELTEKVILSSSFKAKSIIDQLTALGVKIAIADFSGSYESLRYLRKTAVNQIKIDCKDLTAGDEERSNRMIVDALVNLSKGMKIPVIGSHMEKQVSLEIFKAMGGSVIQGKIIDAGVVPEELEIWLKKQMG
ncbi:MAG: EAL domain-containing protein [Colwellia sp.]